MQTVKSYGIEETIDVFDAVDKSIQLYKAVYGDDKKINADDVPDLISNGPAWAIATMKAIQGGDKIPYELSDLNEEEKQVLYARFGEKVNDPRYQKVFKGLLEVSDGIIEIVRGEPNSLPA